MHGLLSKAGLRDQKANLVLSFTDGRSESSADLLANEADSLIKYLKSFANTSDAENTMRRKIIAMCHRINWTKSLGKVDMGRLNGWCREKSYLKKNLNDYKYNELPKLVSEFTNVYKYYIGKVS